MKLTPAEGAAAGAVRRDAGIVLAEQNRERLVCRGTLALVEALLASPDGTATTDAATSDIDATYADGGRWRGGIPKRLAADRFIERAGVVSSCRPARHAGYTTVWRIRDRRGLEARRDSLRARLAAIEYPPTKTTGETVAADSPAS